LAKNPLSWLENIASDNSGFSVSGFTTKRRSVLEFSKLFPAGNISSIIRYDIEDQNLWQFEISYAYPDAKEVKKNENLIMQQEVVLAADELEEAKKFLEVSETDTLLQTEEEQPGEQLIDENEINRSYRHTLDVYFAGDYQSALKLLNDFLDTYPDHLLANNATYYKGECLYLLQRYNEAMEIFEKIYRQRDSKAPDALMMLGNCWEKLGDKNMARASWNNLIADFPNEEVSVAAKYKLNKLERQ
jgi:tol-pal system protein YbgF